MRPVEIGGVAMHMESPEAPRYFAPILISPGLFQSFVCWRGFTSMLAHRGWEVYLLPRIPFDEDGEPDTAHDQGWRQSVEAVEQAAAALGDKVILFGADVGAALALAAAERTSPLALGLFAPAEPGHVGASVSRGLGVFGRRRLKKESGLVHAPAAHAKTAFQEADLTGEPRTLVRELVDGVAYRSPHPHPPAIVFGPRDDPYVATGHALSFADNAYSKASASGLAGRWWPSVGWEAACEEAHRFLILTLGDRVVDFPDEIINS